MFCQFMYQFPLSGLFFSCCSFLQYGWLPPSQWHCSYPKTSQPWRWYQPSVLTAPQYNTKLLNEICIFVSSPQPLMLQRWHPAMWAVLRNPPLIFGSPWEFRHSQSSALCCQQCLSLEVVQNLTLPCLAMLRRIQSMWHTILFVSKILPFRQEAIHKKKEHLEN